MKKKKMIFTAQNGFRIVVDEDSDPRNTLMFNALLSSKEIISFREE